MKALLLAACTVLSAQAPQPGPKAACPVCGMRVLPHGAWVATALWKTLAEAEEALEGRGLVRGHRHLLLRPEAVVGLRNLESGRLQVNLAGGAVVEVSRGAAPGLKERLGIP
ncbi:MAG TPA: LytTR family DNA-binding domain-containing protein [Holophaga sp.]|nr:LytTR family DNA-binding domain-containing protein [Holophaga sp.]